MRNWLLQICCIFASIIHTISSSNCSAINAYVQIESTSSNNSTTLLSAQANFGPFTYFVPYTEIVLLDASDEICDVNGISSKLNDSIVLVFESDGSCSSRYKAFVAERNGATAVLIANTDLSGDVTPITGDDSIETTIPVRSIPYIDGLDLTIDILSGS